MKLNLNMYKSTGKLHQLHRYEIYEGQDVTIPDNSYILYSSVVGQDGVEFLEVWASVPKDSLMEQQQYDVSEIEKYEFPKEMSLKQAMEENWEDE